MEVSQVGLAVFCLSVIVEGFLIGLAYDTFYTVIFGKSNKRKSKLVERAHRINFPLIGCVSDSRRRGMLLKKMLLFFYDLIFLIVVGIATAIFIYRFNDGRSRLSIIVLLPTGYLIYRGLFQSALITFVELVRFIIKCFLSYVFYFTVRPVKRLIRSAGRSMRGKIERAAEFHIQNSIKRYSEKEKARMLQALSLYGAIGYIIKKGDKNDKNDQQNNNLDNDGVACRDCNSCHG